MSDPISIVAGEQVTLLSPVHPGERIQVVDVLRGLALFGVVTANILYWFSGTFFLFPEYAESLRQLSLNSVAFHVTNVLISGKFVTMLSFLFGLGFSIQMMRAEERGRSVAPVYSRRLLALVIFGILHAFFLWYGDILAVYGLLGFGLLLFRRRSGKTLLIWAVLLLIVCPVAIAAVPAVLSLVEADAGAAAELEEEQALMAEKNARWLAAFSGESYPEVVSANIEIYSYFYLTKAFLFVPFVFGLFLLGLCVGRAEIFQNTKRFLPSIRRFWWWSLGVGMSSHLLSSALFLAFPFKELMANPWLTLVDLILRNIGMPALSLFYICSVILLFQKPAWRRSLSLLAPVGRMALSNYLCQTVLCLFIFYGFGLGLIGEYGPLLALPIGMVVFSLQIVWSRWWLSRFQFGPMEWLWRSLTYLRPQPMHASKEIAEGAAT